MVLRRLVEGCCSGIDTFGRKPFNEFTDHEELARGFSKDELRAVAYKKLMKP